MEAKAQRPVGAPPVTFRTNLVVCTATILDEIAAGLPQKDVAMTYALAIKSEAEGADKPDWPKINRAHHRTVVHERAGAGQEARIRPAGREGVGMTAAPPPDLNELRRLADIDTGWLRRAPAMIRAALPWLLDRAEECFALAADQCHDGYAGEHGDHRCREVDDALARAETAEARAERAEAENARLREALRPFAEWAAKLAPAWMADDLYVGGGVTAGALRRAARALTQTEAGDDPR